MAAVPAFPMKPRPDDELGHTFTLNWNAIDRALARRRRRNAWTPAQKRAAARRIARSGGSSD
jgi:hypothetical protein